MTFFTPTQDSQGIPTTKTTKAASSDTCRDDRPSPRTGPGLASRKACGKTRLAGNAALGLSNLELRAGHWSYQCAATDHAAAGFYDHRVGSGRC